MTFEQLRVLQAVVVEGSIRAAAKSVFKTAPAVSRLIRNLEHEVGLQLLSRENYRPALTDEGRVFYEKSKLVLERMIQLKELGKRLASQEESVVRVAINAVCPLRVLLETIHKVGDQFPESQLNVSTENMGGAMERLREGAAEIAITTQTDMDTTIMEAIPLTTIPIIPVVHKDHILAQQKKVISKNFIRNYTQVIVADSSLRSEKQTLDVVEGGRQCRVTEVAAKKELILAGLGWGGLPQHLIKKELDSGVLVHIHPQDYPIRQSQQYLIRRIDKTFGVVSQTIWQAILDMNRVF